MTPEEVKARVLAIERIQGDSEAAHSAEDALHRDVLRAISEYRCESPGECAALALLTLSFDFERWCA